MAEKAKTETAPVEAEVTEAPKADEPDIRPHEGGRDWNDTRGDAAPVLGHFVEVVEGEHKGRYGTFWSLGPAQKEAVVRTRDKRTDLLSVPVEYLRPALAGRR